MTHTRRSIMATLGGALASLAGVSTARPAAAAQDGGRPAPPVPCKHCSAPASGPGQYLVTADSYPNLPHVVWTNIRVYVCPNGHVFTLRNAGTAGWV